MSDSSKASLSNASHLKSLKSLRSNNEILIRRKKGKVQNADSPKQKEKIYTLCSHTLCSTKGSDEIQEWKTNVDLFAEMKSNQYVDFSRIFENSNTSFLSRLELFTSLGGRLFSPIIINFSNAFISEATVAQPTTRQSDNIQPHILPFLSNKTVVIQTDAMPLFPRESEYLRNRRIYPIGENGFGFPRILYDILSPPASLVKAKLSDTDRLGDLDITLPFASTYGVDPYLLVDREMMDEKFYYYSESNSQSNSSLDSLESSNFGKDRMCESQVFTSIYNKILEKETEANEKLLLSGKEPKILPNRDTVIRMIKDALTKKENKFILSEARRICSKYYLSIIEERDPLLIVFGSKSLHVVLNRLCEVATQNRRYMRNIDILCIESETDPKYNEQFSNVCKHVFG